MPEFEIDIEDIDEADPLKAVIEIERRIRPKIEECENAQHVRIAIRYYRAMKRACYRFGLDFDVAEPENEYTPTGDRLLYETKAVIDEMKIDLLHQNFQSNESFILDNSWKEKVHSYVGHIRRIVERASLTPSLHDGIMAKLHALDQEVDRSRSRMKVFTDTFVDLCAGVSAGANELKPAVSLFERVVGALARLKSQPPTLALPAPATLGLEAPDAEPASEGDQSDTREA